MSENINVIRSETEFASAEDLLVMHITVSNEKILCRRFLIQLMRKMLSLDQDKTKMMNSVRNTHIS